VGQTLSLPKISLLGGAEKIKEENLVVGDQLDLIFLGLFFLWFFFSPSLRLR
jgi:hypothetical protein